MGLFHTLHRVAVATGWVAAAGLAALAWQHRAALAPPLDFFAALTIHEGYPQRVRGELRGRVDRILGETSFRLRTTDKQLANVRLTGITAPSLLDPNLLPDEARQAVAARRRLGELVLSNEVRVTVTHVFQPGAVLGLAWVNGTNVNLLLVREGLARAEKRYLRGLPLRVRYELLHANRLAASRPPPSSGWTTTNATAAPPPPAPAEKQPRQRPPSGAAAPHKTLEPGDRRSK